MCEERKKETEKLGTKHILIQCYTGVGSSVAPPQILFVEGGGGGGGAQPYPLPKLC